MHEIVVRKSGFAGICHFHDAANLWYLEALSLQWFGQMTPWCKFELKEMAFNVLGGDFAQRLLRVGFW